MKNLNWFYFSDYPYRVLISRNRGSKKKPSASATAQRGRVGVKSLRVKLDNSTTHMIEDLKLSSHCLRSMPVSTCRSTPAELIDCASTVDKYRSDTPVFKVD